MVIALYLAELNTGIELRKDMKDSKGFSLREPLIAIAILSIITLVVYELYISHKKTWVSQDLIAEMRQSGRFAVDAMIKEIEGGMEVGKGNIIKADAERLAFRTAGGKEVSFYLENGELKMDTIEDARVLAENVKGLEFGYFDEHGNTAGNIKRIGRITISLTMETSGEDPVTMKKRSMTIDREVEVID